MHFLTVLLLSVYPLFQLQEERINDKGIKEALRAAVDSILEANKLVNVNFQLTARIENGGSTKVVYVGTIVSVGGFKFGLPDKFAMLDSRYVFLYEGKNKTGKAAEFAELQKQFGHLLIDDLDENGNIRESFDAKNIDFYSFRGKTLRFVVRGAKIESVKTVCYFPDTSFYDQGYQYDSKGDLVYSDLAYHLCAVDKPFTYMEYDIHDYLTSKDVDSHKLNVGAVITIEKDGRVGDVQIEDKKNELDYQTKQRYKKAFLDMPAWNKARVRGRPVRYRVNFGF